MPTEIPCQTPLETAAHTYVGDLLDRAAALRLPELFASHIPMPCINCRTVTGSVWWPCVPPA
jgi:hypothetical protein